MCQNQEFITSEMCKLNVDEASTKTCCFANRAAAASRCQGVAGNCGLAAAAIQPGCQVNRCCSAQPANCRSNTIQAGCCSITISCDGSSPQRFAGGCCGNQNSCRIQINCNCTPTFKSGCCRNNGCNCKCCTPQTCSCGNQCCEPAQSCCARAGRIAGKAQAQPSSCACAAQSKSIRTDQTDGEDDDEEAKKEGEEESE